MAHSTTPRRIVVGVDGSPASLEALRWAARLAPLIGAQIDALIAWQYPASYGWNLMPPEADARKDAAHELDVALKTVFEDARPADLRELVVQGHPAHLLLDVGRHAELIVVGSRGHGGFVGLLIGSVSAHVAEHAVCPVLVVHGDRGTQASAAAQSSAQAPAGTLV